MKNNVPKYRDSSTYSSDEQRLKGVKLLEEGCLMHSDMRSFYADRERNFRYTYGDQWSDYIEDPNTGESITERQYILEDGRTPIQNNLIAKTVRNLIGQFRNSYGDAVAYSRTRENAKASEIMTNALQSVLDSNMSTELDAAEFREFMISGGFGWKITYDFISRLDMEDVKIKNIQQSRFFHNIDSNDVRQEDVHSCGELHDLSMDEVLRAFATSKKDEERYRDMFPYAQDYEYYDGVPDYINKFRDFYVPDNVNKVRVIEYWKKEYAWIDFVHDLANAKYVQATEEYFMDQGLDPEMIEMYDEEELVQIINNDRLERAMEMGIEPEAVPLIEYESRYEEIWKVYFLSPYGDILAEFETPYDHQEHPYVFGYHPLIDGKVQSLTSTLLDQQRFVNRMIQMMDLGMSQAIKNLMWIPVDMIPEGMSREVFAQQANTYNGIMYYVPKPGVPPPQPISSNSQIAGQTQMLQIMMEMIENISSVNDAVQGNAPNSGTPAALYAQRTNNALISNKDYYDFFFAILRVRNRKILKVIKQYYREQRYVRVAGSGFTAGSEGTYDPDSVRDLEFDTIIGETQNTLAYRQIQETSLREFLGAQFITFEEYLQNSSEPYADSLLQTLANRKNELMQGQGMMQGGQVGPAQGMLPQGNPTGQP